MFGERTFVFYIDEGDEAAMQEIENMELPMSNTEKMVHKTFNILGEMVVGAIDGYCSSSSSCSCGCCSQRGL